MRVKPVACTTPLVVTELSLGSLSQRKANAVHAALLPVFARYIVDDDLMDSGPPTFAGWALRTAEQAT